MLGAAYPNKHMTVRELIQALESMPSEADVLVPSRTGGWSFVNEVDVDEDDEDIVKID